MDITAETITIFVGVVTLAVGVVNSMITNKQTVQSQHLQILLSVSDSFTQKWEKSWGETLDELDVNHLSARTEKIPVEKLKEIRFMLNWVNWLGAMKSSGALNELGILTSSIGIAIKRILNAGYTTIKEDTEKHGADYWNNLFVVAKHLGVQHIIDLEYVTPNKTLNQIGAKDTPPG